MPSLDVPAMKFSSVTLPLSEMRRREDGAQLSVCPLSYLSYSFQFVPCPSPLSQTYDFPPLPFLRSRNHPAAAAVTAVIPAHRVHSLGKGVDTAGFVTTAIGL